jgi:hypothetical protein
MADAFQHPTTAISMINADGTDLTQVLGGDFKRQL